MSSDLALRADRVCKVYHAFDRPSDRLKQALTGWRRRYDREFWALRHVSFDVRRGEAFGIVGRNGSGKSTLLQIVAGALAPTSGEVSVAGRLATLLALGAGFDPELTGRENVYLNAALAGLSSRDVDDRLGAICDFAEIGDFVDQPVKTYSSGMYARLAFSLSISVEPDVMLIDEALAVGDEAFQRKCFARLHELRTRGTTILLASHDAATLVAFCDRALLLDRGERLLVGTPKAVVSSYHRLIYAPVERAEALRNEIRALDAAGDAEAAESEAGAVLGELPLPAPQLVETAELDPGLVPASTVAWEPRGARIHDARIVNGRGEQVNVLRRGETYYCEFGVHFEVDAWSVRFGTMIKNVVGTELGGLASHAPGKGVPFVDAGSHLRVRIPFRARLLAGTYFANAGVVGAVDGGEQFLHRILDAVMFRVAVEKDLHMTELVDFSADEPARVEPAPPPREDPHRG